MDRASPAEIRKSLELAHTLAKAGILFAPIPLLTEEDKADFGRLIQNQMARIEQEVAHG